MKQIILNIFKKDIQLKFRFLIIGGINTVFGFFLGVINYKYFYNFLGAVLLGILNSIIAITFSFFMFKFFVFKTRVQLWFNEYLKSYVVYAFKIIVGIFVLWISLEIFNLNIYFSQANSMLATIFVTYNGHKNYTFKN
tara:strand:- start:163 stop:576 length:414 start_codon:yes stop_codon:yes gene_type:complete